MWCPSCRADVAAELSTDNRRMICARCQTELGIAAAAAPQIANTPRNAETERDARELLARWSAQNLLDVPAPSLGVGPFAKPNGSTELPIARSELRFDLPRPTMPGPSTQFIAAAIAKQQSSPSIPLHGSVGEVARESEHGVPRHAREENLPQKNPFRVKKHRPPRIAEASVAGSPPMNPSPQAKKSIDLDSPHERGDDEQGHHDGNDRADNEHDAVHIPLRHPTSWSTLAGQLCAYAGVGLLTCGSVLVMWSYFGGPPKYMPTGWLTAAVGQMLLFLGIVALISSGMDQTISEVSWRIDHLAEEIHHMGLALDDLEHEHRKARVKRTRTDRPSVDDGQTREAA